MSIMKPYQNVDRFKDNLRHIARTNELMARVLERVKPASRVVIDANGAFNVDLGGGALLYPGDARAAADQQVANYLEEPLRLSYPQDEVGEMCVEFNRYIRALADRLAPTARAAKRAPFSGFVIVFGVGLGYHVKALAEQLEFKTLIVVEPHDELIVHSLHVVDWKGVMQSLSRQGRDIRFVRGDDLFAQLLAILRGPCYPFIDGSYIYTHYQAEAFATLSRRLLRDDLELIALSGWFEDQMTMLRNNTANFSRAGFHLRKTRVPTPRALPAFVVGAGPSLDLDLEDIRRCRGDVVLISASSALKVLLEHGLRPDIHCEVENTAGLAEVAADLAAKHGGLSDITLFASSTVDPRIAPHFKTAIYFFRDGLSSTCFYGQGAESTPFSEPTSGNTAMHCAISLGFREIYLFGLDFGARDPDHHHSRHSVYFTYESEAEIATYTPYAFDAQVPANFGGQVMSGWILNMGRKSIADAIRAVGNVRVMNCSDGSLIPLTKPMAAEALSFSPSAVARARDMEDALSQLTFCPEPPANLEKMKRLHHAFHDFLDGCLEIVATTNAAGVASQPAIIALCDRMIARLSAQEMTERAVYGTLVGHTQLMLQGAFHHASTFAPEGAEAGMAILLQGLLDGFHRLGQLVDAEFEHLLDALKPAA